MQKAKWLLFLTIVLLVSAASLLASKPKNVITINEEATPTVTPLPTPSMTPIPTEKPLSFQQMSDLYGPCVNVPVLMYHHIQPKSEAVKKGQVSLSVDDELFRDHMQHLRDKGYVSITPADLIAFFDDGRVLPSKSIMITFDDGYSDNMTFAFPILKEFGFKGVIFLPTGLMENEGYLSWSSVMEINSSGYIVFGNHTWSHMSVGGNQELVRKEITTADIQLAEKGLNNPKIFAYPFGAQNGTTKTLLSELGYKLAFTTNYGRTMCKKLRLSLPRIRGAHALEL